MSLNDANSALSGGRRHRCSREHERVIEAVVFDLGGVLIDWNPRHLYRQLFAGDAAAMERFLAEVCTQDWNVRQDAGRPFAEGVAELQARFPAHADLIAAYDARWGEMLAGPIEDNVALLAELAQAGVPLYALSNWSAEKFPIARGRFDFLDWFAGIVVSGEVGLVKPDPAIFRHAIERFALTPEATIFIDDSAHNAAAAATLGFAAVHMRSPGQLREELRQLGLDLEPG
jgi:2-haloacid dehalogenase